MLYGKTGGKDLAVGCAVAYPTGAERIVKGQGEKRRSHRATGRPRGRPRVLPENFDEVILSALRRRMDRVTRKVVPYWDSLVEEFHISRKTLAKAIRSLKAKGLIQNTVDYSIYGTDTSGTVYLIASE